MNTRVGMMPATRGSALHPSPHSLLTGTCVQELSFFLWVQVVGLSQGTSASWASPCGKMLRLSILVLCSVAQVRAFVSPTLPSAAVARSHVRSLGTFMTAREQRLGTFGAASFGPARPMECRRMSGLPQLKSAEAGARLKLARDGKLLAEGAPEQIPHDCPAP
jgi:hypothetical protein